MMHGGGVATAKAVSAGAALGTLVNSGKTLPFRIPATVAPTLGTPVDVTLFAVVGFGDLIQRLVLTLDGELAASTACEAVLLGRWRATIGIKTPPGEARGRRRVVLSALRRLGLPTLSTVTQVDALLTSHGLLR